MQYHTGIIWKALAEEGKFYLNPNGVSGEIEPTRMDDLKAQLYDEAREEGVSLSIRPLKGRAGIDLRGEVVRLRRSTSKPYGPLCGAMQGVSMALSAWVKRL